MRLAAAAAAGQEEHVSGCILSSEDFVCKATVRDERSAQVEKLFEASKEVPREGSNKNLRRSSLSFWTELGM